MYYLEITAVVKYRETQRNCQNFHNSKAKGLKKFASKIAIQIKPTLPTGVKKSEIRKGSQIKNYVQQPPVSTFTFYNSIDFKLFNIKDNLDPYI